MYKDKNYVGNKIKVLRLNQNMKQKDLGYGICPQATLADYENGTRVPNCLLLNTLLQRLGQSSDKIFSVLSQKEYAYFQWKAKVVESLEREDFQEAQRLIQKRKNKKAILHEKIEEQFLMFVEGYIEYNYEKMQKAIYLTVPVKEDRRHNHACISTAEMKMILLYLEQKKDKDTRKELEECMRYMKSHYKQEQELVKVYPKVVALLCEYLEEEMEYRWEICREAIVMLRKTGYLQNVVYLLTFLSKDGAKIGKANTRKYTKLLEIFQELYSSRNIPCKERSRIYNDSGQECFLMHEVLRLGRERAGLTQAEVSEYICSSENYSRIESGMVKPRRKNYETFAERLHISPEIYGSDVVCDDYEVISMTMDMERLFNCNEKIEAGKILGKLEERLDLSCPVNRQYINLMKILFELETRNIDLLIKETNDAIGLTVPEWKTGSKYNWKNHIFTRTEIKLINCLGKLYYKKGREEESIILLESVRKYLENSKVNNHTKQGKMIQILVNLEKNLLKMGRYDEAIKCAEKGINLCLKYGMGQRIGDFLMDLAEAIGERETEKKCQYLRYYKQAYFLSDFYFQKVERQYIVNYCKENYCVESEEWFYEDTIL